MIIENNKRDLQYYSHLFSQHCCNYKQEWLKTKKKQKKQKCAAEARTRAVRASHCSLVL